VANYAAHTQRRWLRRVILVTTGWFWSQRKINPPPLETAAALARPSWCLLRQKHHDRNFDAPAYPGWKQPLALNVSSAMEARWLSSAQPQHQRNHFECMIKPRLTRRRSPASSCIAMCFGEIRLRHQLRQFTTLGYVWNANALNTYTFNFGLQPPEDRGVTWLSPSVPAATMYMSTAQLEFNTDFNNSSFAPQALPANLRGIDPAAAIASGRIDEVAIYNKR